MIEIKNRFTGEIIVKSKKKAVREVVEFQVKKSADLRNANLRNADLESADLRNANLRNADLRNADLWNANLRNADLWSANLESANLGSANLESANLGNADLRNANLRNADLWNANLRNADLGIKVPPIDSHQFISEVLYRESKTENQLDFSARIRLQQDDPSKYCWKYFIELAQKKRVLKWAMKILFQWEEFKQKYEEEKNE